MQDRLDVIANRASYLKHGPVSPETTGTVQSELQEVAAQAIIYGQEQLAAALCMAITEIKGLPAQDEHGGVKEEGMAA